MNSKLIVTLGALALFGISISAYSGPHADEAIIQLNKAIESAKSGDSKASADYAEQAKQHLIMEDKDHPYPVTTRRIPGENTKQEHDEAAFGEINKAEKELEKNKINEAIKHEKNAETDIKLKEQEK
jgi:hypothetical protein